MDGPSDQPSEFVIDLTKASTPEEFAEAAEQINAASGPILRDLKVERGRDLTEEEINVPFLVGLCRRRLRIIEGNDPTKLAKIIGELIAGGKAQGKREVEERMAAWSSERS